MYYRTKTYIAGDWTGDSDAIRQMYKWKEGNFWSLSFVDVHEFKQARDGSLNCTIKRSLRERMNMAKTFVLIVGDKTDSVTAGGCQFCGSYNSWNNTCSKGKSIDYSSYVKYECEQAVKADIKIVVLYNSTKVDRSKCPVLIRNKGIHVAMKKYAYSIITWDYRAVKDALE